MGDRHYPVSGIAPFSPRCGEKLPRGELIAVEVFTTVGKNMCSRLNVPNILTNYILQYRYILK